jgi:HSP20 family protein
MNLGSLIPWRDTNQSDANLDSYSDPFVSFRREVDRMFDDFFTATNRRGLQPWNAGWQAITPWIDIFEADKELVITAEVPGLDEKDFEVTLVGDLLTIKGEKKTEHEDRNGGAYYVERRYGAFSRSLRLPFEAGDQQVEANYDRGVLIVRVPKPPEAQRHVRRIEVKAT